MASHLDGEMVSTRDLDRLERRADVLRLRNQGVPYKDIAKKHSVSTQTVYHDIQIAVKDVLDESAGELVATQKSILRDIIKAQYPGLLAGDTKAAEVMLKALAHQATLLGINAPSRVAVTAVQDEDFSLTLARMMISIGVQPPPEIAPPDLYAEIPRKPVVVDAVPDDWVTG